MHKSHVLWVGMSNFEFVPFQNRDIKLITKEINCLNWALEIGGSNDETIWHPKWTTSLMKLHGLVGSGLTLLPLKLVITDGYVMPCNVCAHMIE